jgi:LmbE family N-acetylglucosaminyl deacetylase
MKILVIGAHFDDAEIGAGGTLTKHVRNGDDIYYAITSADEFRTGDVCERLGEQIKALKIMGIPKDRLIQFSYKEEIHNIIGELDLLKPDIVFTQCFSDTHQDHKRSSIIGEAIGRKRNITTVFYDSGSSYDFQPNVFSIIDFKKKFKLLNCFESQIECGAINLNIIKRKNHYWASLISNTPSDYAEGFVVRKMSWII